MFSRLLCQGIAIGSNKMLLSRLLPQTIATFETTTTNVTRLNRHSGYSFLSKTRISNIGSSKLTVATNTTESQTLNILDVNTNVANKVFLYKFERNVYFRCMNVFAVFQFLFWLGISYFTYSELPPLDSEPTLVHYVKENSLRIVVASLAILAGIGSAFLIFVFTARSVKYVILNRGGNTATIVTYHPINEHVSFTVPLDEIKCKSTRKEIRNYLPLKLQGRWFHYMLDANGKFVNPTLFDLTVGASRS